MMCGFSKRELPTIISTAVPLLFAYWIFRTMFRGGGASGKLVVFNRPPLCLLTYSSVLIYLLFFMCSLMCRFGAS